MAHQTGNRLIASAALTAAALVFLLLPAAQVGATRAQAVQVSTFFATTSQAYDSWAKTNYAPPPSVTAFSAGTHKVSVYFRYSGAGSGDTAYVILRRHDGPTLDLLSFSALPAGTNQASMGRLVPSPALTPGLYDLDLLVDYHLFATITISLGGTVPPTGGTQPGTVAALKVTTFYAITPAGASAWLKQAGFNPLPTAHPLFTAGTNVVSFIIVFKGAVAKVTKHEIKVHGPNGLTLTDGGPYVFTFAAGGVVDQVQAPSGLALPNGSYTADLLVAGRQAATTTFTVGQPESATSGAKM